MKTQNVWKRMVHAKKVARNLKGSDNDSGDGNSNASSSSGDESGDNDKESWESNNESSKNNARGETRHDDYDMCALRHRGREISHEDESGGLTHLIDDQKLPRRSRRQELCIPPINFVFRAAFSPQF
ncbi:hypothetical protein LR48_Vigan252s000200 [Vigna angularis]|uniref:Uncharacterized protein n=1 Tax=Phaseolus angularis TaxID=3914 RepID=A0A0L9T6R1_PHAAN|nr:hypothetical protein LR48_Vigan252s000200 [Vigna angularis]